MNPNLFHLDWERTIEVLGTIIVLSFMVERALALLFEHRIYVKVVKGKGLKEVITFVVSLVLCIKWDFDAVGMIILAQKTTLMGEIVTAGVIAGGAKSSIKLFHDVMKTMSTEEAIRKGIKSGTSDKSVQTV